MKYIIRRIIIGVGIAVAMMLITRTFSLSAYAATTFYVAPNELRLTYTNSNSNTNTTTYSTLNQIEPTEYPYNTFYGRSNINSGYMVHQQLYRVEVPTTYKSGYYDINFLYYNATIQDYLLNGLSFNVRNSSRVHVCQSDNLGNEALIPFVNNNYNSPYSGRPKTIIGVSCENVYLELNNSNVVYSIIQHSWSPVDGNTAYGISALTFQHNDSNDQIIKNQQTIIQKEQQQTDAINDVNDTINDTTTSDAESSASNFFNNFTNTDHGGLSGIITKPLEYIARLSTGSNHCDDIIVPIPFVNNSARLPCLSDVIYYSSASRFLTLYRVITTGLIAYYVLIKMFATIRGFKDPEKDKVEVLEL